MSPSEPLQGSAGSAGLGSVGSGVFRGSDPTFVTLRKCWISAQKHFQISYHK